jgi:hypothetical protein
MNQEFGFHVVFPVIHRIPYFPLGLLKLFVSICYPLVDVVGYHELVWAFFHVLGERLWENSYFSVETPGD